MVIRVCEAYEQRYLRSDDGQINIVRHIDSPILLIDSDGPSENATGTTDPIVDFFCQSSFQNNHTWHALKHWSLFGRLWTNLAWHRDHFKQKKENDTAVAKRLQIHVVIVIDSSCIKFLTNCISIDMFQKQKHLFEWMRLKMLCRSRFQCWWSWTWGGGCEVEVKVVVWWGWGWGWSWGGGHEVALSLLGLVVSRCCISARSYSPTDNVYDAQTCLPPSQTQTQRLLVGFH